MTEEEKELAIKQREKMNQRAIELADIDRKFGLDKYDRIALETEVKTHLENSAKSMLEAGRKLVLLKEHEGHGNFTKCLERIGIGHSVANKMMKAVVKLAGLKDLNSYAHTNLSPTKIHELVLLDDEDLKELSETGTVANLSLDNIESMTTRELKAECKKLKQAKKDIEKQLEEVQEVNDQILADKNKKIDNMDKELRILTDPTKWQEKAEMLLKRLHGITPQYSKLISDFIQIVTEIEGMNVKEWEQSQIILIEQCKHNASLILSDAERLSTKVNYIAPEHNGVYHELNDLRLPLKVVSDDQ